MKSAVPFSKFISALIGVIAWALPCLVLGLSVDFDIQPRAIHVGEAAMVSFTIRGVDNPQRPALPPINSFQVNIAGEKSSLSFGAGGRDSESTFFYQLIPLQTGKFKIGPFAYEIQGQTKVLPEIELTVVGPESSTAPGAGQPNMSELLFADLTVGSTNVYNQQVFDIVLSIYSRGLNFGNNISLMNMPSGGLNLQPFQEMPSTREVVSNQLYDVRRFRCKAQALTAGTFTLAPALRIPLQVQRERQRRSDSIEDLFGRSPFQDLFGAVQTQPVDITPKPLTVAVHPLPTENQPPLFSGAVGHFSFDVQVKPTDLNVGDPITVTMQISGEGNLENVAAPQVVSGDGFKVYEPKLITREINEAQASGRKVFEQVLIPRSDSVKELPVISFAYFDPIKAAYETASQGPFPLTLHSVSNAVAQVLQSSVNQPETRTLILGADIIYLKPAPQAWPSTSAGAWYKSRLFLVIQCVPLLTLLALFVRARRRDILEKDIAQARRHQAPRSARAAVRKAEQALSTGDRRQFFESVWEAMASYFGNRLNLSAGEVTGDAVLNALTAARANSAILETLRTLFGRCEQERFGHEAGATEPLSNDDKKEGAGILSHLHNVLKQCERIRI